MWVLKAGTPYAYNYYNRLNGGGQKTDGPTTWTGRLGHGKVKDLYGRETAIFAVNIMDAKIEHLHDLEISKSCSFETSWERFNQQHNGQRHSHIVIAGYFANIIVITNLLFLFVVYKRRKFNISFYTIMLSKFLLQDLPMQFVIATFLYGWYGKAGLRCQLCLFDADHCAGT